MLSSRASAAKAGGLHLARSRPQVEGHAFRRSCQRTVYYAVTSVRHFLDFPVFPTANLVTEPSRINRRRGGARSASRRQFSRHRWWCRRPGNHQSGFSNSPTVFIAVKLFASRRPWVIGEVTYFWPDAFDDLRCQVTKFPFRRRCKGDFIQTHLILPSARSSASTSSRLKRGSPARASDMIPSSMSS